MATTENIILIGEQTIDGVGVISLDRVLVKDQTDQTKNGIYCVDTAAWTRAKDFNGAYDVKKGTAVWINEEGTVNANTIWRHTGADDPNFGVTNITFLVVGFAFHETFITVPSGVIFQTDIINETTVDAGITVNGLLFKDGCITGVACLAKDQTFTGAQRNSWNQLTDGANIAVDFASGNNFYVTVGGDRTIDAPSNVVVGQSGMFIVEQDGTGGHTTTFAATWDFGDTGSPVPDETANKKAVFGYVVDWDSRVLCTFSGDF